jgi:MFS transporter, FHS family, glucose/mannose:H+ symporter
MIDTVEKKAGLLVWIMLVFTFFMPAILLNTVGAVILNMVNTMNVSMGTASWLEGVKDGSIMLGAFILASFIPSFGYRKSLILAIILEIIGCILFALFPSIFVARIFFIFCGVAFALIKSTVYASVGLYIEDSSKHASLFSLLEGIFMAGVLSGMWIYSFFMAYFSWEIAFWFFGAMCLINLILAFVVKLDESKVAHEIVSPKEEIKKDITGMLSLFKKYAVWVFAILAFFYVFIEQGVITWLPVYNNRVLGISNVLSLQLASLFPAGLCIGRFLGALAMRKISWVKLLFLYLIVTLLVFIVAIVLASGFTKGNTEIVSWLSIPLAAWLIPLSALFIAPLYPTICSSIVNSQPTKMQSSMSGLVLLFSAIGGTVGSRIVGSLFEMFGGLTAIKAPIIPIIVLIIVLIPYYMVIRNKKNDMKA